jgi:type I restriction enzyme S subunit
MIGANRGMACLVEDKRIFSIKNVGLVKKNENLNGQFLLYFLKSRQAREYVRSGSKGGAQEFIGLTELRSFPIPLPSLSHQNQLAASFQALSIETERLGAIYRQKLAAIAELRRCILQKAFSGELTSAETIAA